jgi:hypothetical protein
MQWEHNQNRNATSARRQPMSTSQQPQGHPSFASPFQIPHCRILGRTDGRSEGPLPLHWTASGVLFNLRASSLLVDVEADYTDHAPWISLSLNGQDLLRMPLQKGRHTLSLLQGLDPAQSHVVRILRESQAMPGDPRCRVLLHGLACDGQLAPLPEPACRIEFIGDSLTSAEGAWGCPADTEWLPLWFAGAKGYPQRIGDRLNAEVRVISQSGWGVCSGWDNDPNSRIPKYYHQVCGVIGARDGGDAAYDFTSWKPNLVVCALGANDWNALRADQGFTDPATGEVFKQSMDNLAPLGKGIRDFLAALRERNPDAVIVWVFWAGGDPILSLIRKAVDDQRAAGDTQCFMETVPGMKPDGARNHPGLAQHERLAAILATRLKRHLR